MTDHAILLAGARRVGMRQDLGGRSPIGRGAADDTAIQAQGRRPPRQVG